MSEEQLEPFLPKSFNHKIEKFCRLDASSFNALVRVDIKSEEDVDKWRREFQEQSGTNFIVGHTYPDVQRTQFKKEFVCLRSSKNKLDSEKDNRRSSIKLNANCKAKIMVSIKLNTEKTRRTDHLIREGFLGVIHTAISEANEQEYPQFCHHLASLWASIDTVTLQPKRYLWCKAYRKGMTIGNETNNYAESNIRIFKDIILSRLKGYNSVALIFLTCGKYEQYYQKRLLDFANGRKPTALFRLNALREKAAYLSDVNQISRQSEAVFDVPSSNGNDSYEVNISHPSCTCPIGFTGAICKHQYAVSCLFDIPPLINVPKVSPKDCRDMATIAVGKENAPQSTFYDFDSIESTTNEENFVPMEVSDELPVAPAKKGPTPWFDKEKIVKNRQLLIENFSNAVNSLAMDNASAHYAVNRLSRELSKSSPNQVLSILYSAISKGRYKHDNGTSIGVNAAAKGRRLKGKGGGSKPAQKGRPSTSAIIHGATRSLVGKFPSDLPKKKVFKRKNNLGESIKENRPNAKKHGESH